LGFDRLVRLGSFVFAALVVSIASPPVFAQGAPDKKVCIAAAERGQELRNTQKMRDARSQFLLCARKECPAAVSGARWTGAPEAEPALGSVKLEAFDETNKKITAVKISIDGAPAADEIPATPVILDPGSHEIRFERPGSETITRTVSLAMGERDQLVQAHFKWADKGASKPAVTTKPDSESKPPERGGEGGSLVAPIVLGGIGVAAIGTATAFWLMGNSDLDDAKARCQNGCTETTADDAKTKHLIGDIALGVGIVAIAAAAYFLVTREKAPSPVIRF
jgi:hypothetical protein